MPSLSNLREWTLPLKVRLLKLACGRIERIADSGAVTRADVLLLMLAWGNIGYAAGLSYLQHMASRVSKSTGQILECGSGASTLLIGATTRHRGVKVVVLENSPLWHSFMARIIKQLDHTHVTVVHAPLVDYEGYSWYTAPDKQIVEPIELVVCDGPPGKTRGGRYGLLPVMNNSLAKGCTILLNDTHRKSEREIIDAWRIIRPLTAQPIGVRGAHSEVVFSAGTHTT